MKNTSKNPEGTKRDQFRREPEKEVLMKTTKTMKAMAIVYAALICVNIIPACMSTAHAADLNATVTGTAYAQGNGQERPEVQAAPADDVKPVAIMTALMSYVVTPWGVAPVVMTAYAGAGMIVGAILPGNHAEPDRYEAAVLAQTK
jgi:hypothetical protein